MTATETAVQEQTQLKLWLDALVESVEELSTTTLAFDKVELVNTLEEAPTSLSGSYIGLVGEDLLQIGLASDEIGCQTLARALFCLEPDEDDLPKNDVVDAMGEIINVLAGVVKTKMVEVDSSLKLGLPIVVNGRVEISAKSESIVGELMLGPVKAFIIAIRAG